MKISIKGESTHTKQQQFTELSLNENTPEIFITRQFTISYYYHKHIKYGLNYR